MLQSILKELAFLEIVRLGSFPLLSLLCTRFPLMPPSWEQPDALVKFENISPVSLLTAPPEQLLSRPLVMLTAFPHVGARNLLSNECRTEITTSYVLCGLCFFSVTFSQDYEQTGFQFLFLESKNDPLH